MNGAEPIRKDKPQSVPVLRLPNLSDEGQPGVGFVKRAVGLTLLTLALLVGGGLLVSVLVDMDVTVKAGGVLEPVKVWPVRSLESGAIREVLVETGDTVKAGEPVIRLDPLALETQLAELRAQRTSTVTDRTRSLSSDPLQRREQDDRIAQASARLVTARATLRQRMVEYDLGADMDGLLRSHRPGQHVAVDLAVAEVRAAEAELRLSGTQADALSLSRFDRAKTEAELERLDAQIRSTEERLRRLTVTAPTTGVVLTEQIERLPGAMIGTGDLLLEMGDLGDWRITLNVRESDVHKIEVGDSVKVEVQAFSAAERDLLRGVVTYVSPEPLGSGGGAGGGPGGGAAPAAAPGGVYRVVARLDQDQIREVGFEKFRRGYTVQGHVITRSGKIISLIWNYLTEKLK